VILVENGSVAAIERIRAGNRYHVLPGQIEPGEEPAPCRRRPAPRHEADPLASRQGHERGATSLARTSLSATTAPDTHAPRIRESYGQDSKLS
jgi:hypothetical protein